MCRKTFRVSEHAWAFAERPCGFQPHIRFLTLHRYPIVPGRSGWLQKPGDLLSLETEELADLIHESALLLQHLLGVQGLAKLPQELLLLS